MDPFDFPVKLTEHAILMLYNRYGSMYKVAAILRMSSKYCYLLTKMLRYRTRCENIHHLARAWHDKFARDSELVKEIEAFIVYRNTLELEGKDTRHYGTSRYYENSKKI